MMSVREVGRGDRSHMRVRSQALCSRRGSFSLILQDISAVSVRIRDVHPEAREIFHGLVYIDIG